MTRQIVLLLQAKKKEKVFKIYLLSFTILSRWWQKKIRKKSRDKEYQGGKWGLILIDKSKVHGALTTKADHCLKFLFCLETTDRKGDILPKEKY